MKKSSDKERIESLVKLRDFLRKLYLPLPAELKKRLEKYVKTIKKKFDEN